MPSVPTHGAAGGESFSPSGDPPQGTPPAQHAPDPPHGADGGYDRGFWEGEKFRAPNDGGRTGMDESNPALGGGA